MRSCSLPPFIRLGYFMVDSHFFFVSVISRASTFRQIVEPFCCTWRDHILCHCVFKQATLEQMLHCLFMFTALAQSRNRFTLTVKDRQQSVTCSMTVGGLLANSTSEQRYCVFGKPYLRIWHDSLWAKLTDCRRAFTGNVNWPWIELFAPVAMTFCFSWFQYLLARYQDLGLLSLHEGLQS